LQYLTHDPAVRPGRSEQHLIVAIVLLSATQSSGLADYYIEETTIGVSNCKRWAMTNNFIKIDPMHSRIGGSVPKTCDAPFRFDAILR
jgi:hypothetical protein